MMTIKIIIDRRPTFTCLDLYLFDAAAARTEQGGSGEAAPLEFILRGHLGNGEAKEPVGLELIPDYHVRRIIVQGGSFGSPQPRTRV
jgi:hypothetical protein